MAKPLDAGDAVEDFTLASVDGDLCSSADARKDGLLLFAFWKKTCGTCQYSFPYLQRFQVLYGGEKFRIWGVAQENAEDTLEFRRRFGATFTQLVDEDLAVTERYGLVSVPTLYLVDHSDRILQASQGFDTDSFNRMARAAAERTGEPYSPIVRPEDSAPAHKPG